MDPLIYFPTVWSVPASYYLLTNQYQASTNQRCNCTNTLTVQYDLVTVLTILPSSMKLVWVPICTSTLV